MVFQIVLAYQYLFELLDVFDHMVFGLLLWEFLGFPVFPNITALRVLALPELSDQNDTISLSSLRSDSLLRNLFAGSL